MRLVLKQTEGDEEQTAASSSQRGLLLVPGIANGDVGCRSMTADETCTLGLVTIPGKADGTPNATHLGIKTNVESLFGLEGNRKLLHLPDTRHTEARHMRQQQKQQMKRTSQAERRLERTH